jgi:hypothetical protein
MWLSNLLMSYLSPLNEIVGSDNLDRYWPIVVPLYIMGTTGPLLLIPGVNIFAFLTMLTGIGLTELAWIITLLVNP